MKTMIKKLLLGGFITVALFACRSDEKKTVSDTPILTEGTECKRVDKTTFKAFMENNSDFQLVDVRTPQEYEAGKIGDAININFISNYFVLELQKLDKEKTTLIYCQSGGRSAQALQKMKEQGFKHVLELEGGFGNWDN